MQWGGHALWATRHTDGIPLRNQHSRLPEPSNLPGRSGRRHRHESEYHARRAEYERSKAFVEGWNARRSTHLAAAAARGGSTGNSSNAGGSAGGSLTGSRVPHRVALNHFADWTREEWLALVKPDRCAAALPRFSMGAGVA